MTHRLAAAAVLWLACGSTDELVLELEDEDGDCATVFADVKTLSIEAVANNGACRLQHQCVFNIEGADEVADLEAAMRDSADILLEVDPAQAQTLEVNGRPKNDCFPGPENAPILCGNVNFSDTEGDLLVVELECSGCTESGPLCP